MILASGCLTGTSFGDAPAIPPGDVHPAKQITSQDASLREEQELASALQKLNTADKPIGPADLLEIRVYQEDDLKRQTRVTDTGYITFPLVGSVKVGGLTVTEAERKLAGLLGKDYLVNPQVTILVMEYQAKKIFILGQVKNPGAIVLPPSKELTVVEAISQAGGFTELAALDRTRVIRVLNGETTRITIKVSDITHHGDRKKDIALLPNDIIYVPEVFF